MCPRKDIEGAVGYVSLKPTIVAADRFWSAQGVVRPFPYRAVGNGMSGTRPGFGTDTKAAVSYLHSVRHTHFSSF